MAFLPSSLPKYYRNHVTQDHPFMTCIVRVNTQSQWQSTVRKVLDKCCGVHSFRMDDNGLIEISGSVDPSLLLKMLQKAGRSAELCWFQFGQCSSNLFMQPNPPGESSYSRDGRFLHATNLSRPKLPSQPALTNQNYAGYYDHDNHYYSYATDHYAYGNDHDHYYSYGNDQGYYSAYPHSYPHHNRNQIHTRSALPQHIGCCTLM